LDPWGGKGIEAGANGLWRRSFDLGPRGLDSDAGRGLFAKLAQHPAVLKFGSPTHASKLEW